MKNNKKIVSMILVFVLMLSTFTTVLAADRDLVHKETKEKKVFEEYLLDDSFIYELLVEGALEDYYVEVNEKLYNSAEVQEKFDEDPTVTLEEAVVGLDSVEEPTEELEVVKASAINAKTLKVNFNKAVEDTSKAVFEVKKGTVKVNTSKITWNEAKTEASLELSGKLTAGEYTVSVTGLTETALTGKVTAENEKVTSIELLSETAPLATTTTATVGYKVVNQYGEDITATTALTGTASGAVVNSATPVTVVKGVATITVNTNAKEGDPIVLTLVHVDTGVSVSQTVKVGAGAVVSELSITSLYNKDNKTLTETTDLNKDAFYLIVEAKDQYGQAVKQAALATAGIIGNNTNANVVAINGGATPTFDTIQVSGKDAIALKLTGTPKAGETTIMLIAPASGKNATYKIVVAESQRADSIVFEVPSVVAANEDLFIPVQITDKAGNAITDEKVAKDPTRGVTLSGVANAAFTTKDGVLGVLVPKASITTAGYVSLVGVTSTAKSTIANIQVKAAAAPTIVTGLTTATSTTLLANGTLAIDTSKLVVEDQYGRVMTKAVLDAWLAADTTNNKIIVEEDTASAVLTSAPAAITNGTPTVTLTAGTTKGTEKVTIKVANAANPTGLATSAKEITFQVTDGSEYASYQVDAIGTVYDEKGAGKEDNAAYNKTIKVYGVLSNGSKVLLTNVVDYSVSSTDATLNADVVDGTIEVKSAYTYPANQTEITLPVTVTINATGEKLTQDVVISKVAPKVTKLEIVKTGEYAKLATNPGLALTPETAINYNTAAAFDYAKLAAAAEVVVTDQYGVKTHLTTATTTFADGTPIVITLTFSKVSGNLKFSGNGSAAASVDEMAKDSVFNVVVSAGSQTSAPLKVTATSAYPVPIIDVTSPAFNVAAANNTVTITLTGGTFKAGTIAATDFTFTGTNAVALAAGTFTRTSDTVVTITGLTLSDATDDKVLVKAATQATQATSVAAVASTN